MTGHKLTLVHPFCTHYTVGLFEELARRFDVQFFFYSDGGERFWPKEHGVRRGSFPHEYLAGFRIGSIRITPALLWKLLKRPADAIVSSCLLYTSPSPRDLSTSRMPSSA